MTNKNHFFMPYAGNKRNEVGNIYENIDFSKDIKYIVEPFAGSGAFSFFLSKMYPKKYEYILNDNDKNLIELYKIAKSKAKTKLFNQSINAILKDDLTKEKYNKLNDTTLPGWYIRHKIYNIRVGLYKTGYKYKPIDIEEAPIVDFLRNEKIKFTNTDGLNVYNEYKNNKNALIFLDPPYLNSCNDYYQQPGTNIYEYLYNNNIKNEDAYIILCLENIWIIKLLFKDATQMTYDKKYEQTKRKTEHVIIFNR